jgi:hypothetical protein
MSHFPRKPVRFIEANEELLDIQKSTSGDMVVDNHPDYEGPTEDAYPARMEPQYRTPHDRVSGNEMFRRNPDGSLDYNYAKNKVIEAVHKVRDGISPTTLEQTALSVLFPAVFSYVDAGVLSAVRAVNLKLSPAESAKISMLVSGHLSSEIEFMLSSQAR